MKPQNDYRNGDGNAATHEDDSEGEEASALEEELSLFDPTTPARALNALNALRKSRQHYDVLLVAGGVEIAAHRAVLAAASPYLLETLAAPAPAPSPPAPAPTYRVEDVDPEALREIVEYAYTGKLRVRDTGVAWSLYRAAWRLRVETARIHLAERLLQQLTPCNCLTVRALPDLAPHHLAQLDTYIAENFDAICTSGKLGTLRSINLEMLRESSAEGGEETPQALADAVLTWLREQPVDHYLEDLCSRTHLLYVDLRGALRDCGELPAARGDAPELQEYKREAVERGRRANNVPAVAPRPLPGLELGARAARTDCAVLAARRANGARTTRALISLRGRLALVKIAWREVSAGGVVAKGGFLSAENGTGEKRAALPTGRCALGAAVLNGKLIVCGGYDRARVLQAAEAYDPALNAWTPLPAMRSARARFPAARLGNTVYALGGSDGHTELDSVDAYEETEGSSCWKAKRKLPLAMSHLAAAVDEAGGALYAIGGWASGTNLKRVMRYTPADDEWTEAPSLTNGRSQCAGVFWCGALWALGGCDAWHCLATTETLPLDAQPAQWRPGPPLPTARRSMGGAVWKGMLVSVGGSDGAASLKRTEWLEQGASAWKPGPDLRKPRAGLGVAVLNEVLYAVGGFDGKEFLDSVECLYDLQGEWTRLRHPPAIQAPITMEPPQKEYEKEKTQEKKENGDIAQEVQ
ncbi:hypothetical protein K1T71_013123 [Dendrolimus kikuchii]|uniref:Uncharacterized protein n=1 Tax=Dendrolimus kikuchii TaxID=765133 RepID=A0ACC1CJ09_9NEOP|nr:hypothetical protein K1T71_013123 [Dendrolimus kikuchii]